MLRFRIHQGETDEILRIAAEAGMAGRSSLPGLVWRGGADACGETIGRFLLTETLLKKSLLEEFYWRSLYWRSFTEEILLLKFRD